MYSNIINYYNTVDPAEHYEIKREEDWQEFYYRLPVTKHTAKISGLKLDLES